MSTRERNPLVRLTAYAVCFTVGLAIAGFGGATAPLGTLLAAFPLLVFFRALFRKASANATTRKRA